jgi:hypothetical protein
MSAILRRPATVIASLCVILVAVGVGSVGSVGAASAAAPYCNITWGSLPEAIRTGTEAPLANVRSGRHECFDRVVFDFDGPGAGYRVEYVPEVRSDGEGRGLRVAGGAILRVVLEANVFDQLGHLHYSRAVGDHVADVGRYRTLRDVVYGGCFEGRTTFGVGVRARLPFRVFSLAGPGSSSRIVLDVAHRW